MILQSYKKLENYVRTQKYKGWDPYDGLNSKVFQSLKGLNSNKIFRLFWIQAFKHSPVNFRPLLMVEKDYNPKALGLFLSSMCQKHHYNPSDENIEQIHVLSDKILQLVSKGWSGSCWGYNFDWQARAFFQPAYTPTVVATSFVAKALLYAYELTDHERYLEAAISSADFILNDLNRTYDDDGDFCFSYSPFDKTQVFNASLLGTSLLSKIYKYKPDNVMLESAEKSLRYCLKYQKTDGSWSYGRLPFHKWVDNFHTGYNLECINDFISISHKNKYEQALNKGFQYYIDTFFTEDGISKYYNNKTYPIDVHAPAQFIVTLVKLNKLTNYKNIADRVLHWTIKNMQDKRGYFYFQKKRFFTSKIPYMRWAQAWMFYALTYYLFNNQNKQE